MILKVEIDLEDLTQDQKLLADDRLAELVKQQ